MRAVTAALVSFALVAAAHPAWTAPKSSLVNLNTATATELQALPGIGPKKADAIVTFRSSNGPFKDVEDLVMVKGIGPKTMDKLRPLVTVGKVKKKRAWTDAGGLR